MLKLQNQIYDLQISILIYFLMLKHKVPIFVTSPQRIWIVKLPSINV